jgi:hypothetical protein
MVNEKVPNKQTVSSTTAEGLSQAGYVLELETWDIVDGKGTLLRRHHRSRWSVPR